MVRQNGKPVELTSVEFNLLHVLLREAGRVVTREHLVDAVLSRKFSPFDRSIDMHVSKVRKKLGDSDRRSDHIKTVRGVGYIFAHPRDAKRARSEAKMRSLFLKIFLSLLDGAGALSGARHSGDVGHAAFRGDFQSCRRSNRSFSTKRCRRINSGGEDAA